jgi:hypothetical protein
MSKVCPLMRGTAVTTLMISLATMFTLCVRFTIDGL